MSTIISGPAIAGRLRLVREELYGEGGLPALAGRLGIPEKTLRNYESGVMIPGPVLLVFLHATGVNPDWMLTGEGPRYLARPDDRSDR